MAEDATKRIAVVTGANKGIGFAICKQLASKGITVVLTARDQKRGLEAVEKLGLECGGVSGQVVFHQLDVTDPASISSLAGFVKTQFGKLDILVNNAGISGEHVDRDAREALVTAGGKETTADWRIVSQNSNIDWSKISTQDTASIELAIRTNYYGYKGMCQALIPLLELSDSPRIVNVSSLFGKLERIPSEWAKGVLSDENLTVEKLDEVVNQFLKDFKEGSLEKKGWPLRSSAYTVSKASLNAFTRIIARKYPSFCINAVCPGFVKTDMTNNTGQFTVDEGAESIVRLVLLPNGSPSGLFFSRSEVTSF